jgi:excisionase family DNA binding protein
VQQCLLRNKMLFEEVNGDDMHPLVDTLIMAMNATPNPTETPAAANFFMQNGPVLWTVRDVADYARCSTRHVSNLRNQGLPFRKTGRLVRFSPEAVKRWFED